MSDRGFLDVDNQNYFPEGKQHFENVVGSHDRIAEYYKYRPPYSNDFFDEVRRKLGVRPDTILLDLCCGRGELASGLSSFVKSVIAVDGSEEMLRRKIVEDNILYQRKDVNADDLELPINVDHILVGSAIHWVKQQSLMRIIGKFANPGAKVMVSGTQLQINREPYYAALRTVNREFCGGHIKIDYYGRKKMEKCGYKQCDSISVVNSASFDTQYLINSQLSYANGSFYDKVFADVDAYRSSVRSAIAPFEEGGRLSAQLVNWALVYAPAAG